MKFIKNTYKKLSIFSICFSIVRIIFLSVVSICFLFDVINIFPFNNIYDRYNLVHVCYKNFRYMFEFFSYLSFEYWIFFVTPNHKFFLYFSLFLFFFGWISIRFYLICIFVYVVFVQCIEVSATLIRFVTIFLTIQINLEFSSTI